MLRSQLNSSSDQVSRATLQLILLAQGVVMLPLFFYLPPWLPLVWILVTVWRIQIFRGILPFPGWFIKFSLGFLCVVVLLVTFRGRLGVEPMVSFLLCGFILKLVEVYRRKDVIIIVNICFVAIAAQFLFSQTLLATLYGLLCVLLGIAVQRAVFQGREEGVKRHLYKSGVLLVQSFPLMLVLFVVIPRVGQLWAVPNRESTARTGFSDSMSPGSLSQLIRSSELAFRVTFEDNRGSPVTHLPPPTERYWRGLVLEHFDGRTWRPQGWRHKSFAVMNAGSPAVPADWELSKTAASRPYRYSIILEPHNHTWLFSMLTPVRVESQQPGSILFHDNFLIATNRPVSARLRYTVNSAVAWRVDQSGLDRSEILHATQLPENTNPRTQRLVESWLAEQMTKEQIVIEALQYYRQSFVYTLNPPKLGANTIDDFLFITQRGFCEHFSSSFVYLMRLAGIPARVVVGYQGGELNRVENYLMVRQSDAHAWAEVWLQDQGWVRVDPTAVVAPSRIENGLRNAIAEEESSLIGGAFKFGALSRLVHYWDALGYQWHRWILAYDNEKQQNLFRSLFGGAEVWRVAVWFLSICAAMLGSYLFVLVFGNRSEVRDFETRLYVRFLEKMSAKGVEREPGEAPQAFARRAANLCPEWEPNIVRITNLYCRVAYQGEIRWIGSLKKAVRLFPRSE